MKTRPQGAVALAEVLPHNLLDPDIFHSMQSRGLLKGLELLVEDSNKRSISQPQTLRTWPLGMGARTNLISF